MSTFQIGFKTLLRFVEDGDVVSWYKNKIEEGLFKGVEVDVYRFVVSHLVNYHKFPALETLLSNFPELAEISYPEPAQYYVDLLYRRYIYDTINIANVESQKILKEDKMAVDKAEKVLRDALDRITAQRYRTKIMEVTSDVKSLVLSSYHKINEKDSVIDFGWPYMDTMCGGVRGGDIVSFVGRPALGKSWLMLWVALHNWRKGVNVLFASMEMNHLAIAQRIASMYAHVPVSGLKTGMPSKTYEKFAKGIAGLESEKSKFYVLDGNLAAYADDIYMIVSQLKCGAVFIDGAYLLRHRNSRLDRYVRVSENAELMKSYTTSLDIPTFASWQFNREAVKKGRGSLKGQKVGLEDIGYSDAIAQISTIVLGMSQEEGVETINSRLIDVLKGRNGEVGQFRVKWDFIGMNFDELVEDDPLNKNEWEMQYI